MPFMKMIKEMYRSSPVFWKYAANLQGNTHANMWFQESCNATLLKSHFGMGILL